MFDVDRYWNSVLNDYLGTDEIDKQIKQEMQLQREDDEYDDLSTREEIY